MLKVSGLTTAYGQITALRGVDLTVDAGEVVGLIGPNGAGKTTMLNTIAGLLTPLSGTVAFDGTDATGSPPEKLLRAGLALVPEHRRIFTELTVEENLKVGSVTVPSSERGALLEQMAQQFEVLRRKWTTAAGFLSGGEAQQLAIARALMSKPRLVLMDEPSLGLAPALVDVIYELIASLRAEGRTLLVVDQNAGRLLEVSDRAYVLRSGEIAATGTSEELRSRDDLFDTFIGT